MQSSEIYQAITDRMIAALEKGVAPWRQPWVTRTAGGDLTGPINADGRPYRGVNYWLLSVEAMDQGYKHPVWLTFKKTKALGGTVRKGEKSTVIIFWKKLTIIEPDETGKPVKKQIPMLRYYRVFNLAQTEGVKLPKKLVALTTPAPEPEAEETEISVHENEAAEAIINGYLSRGGPTIRYDGVEAAYSPLMDRVVVPPLSAYKGNVGEYYSTIFHELGHSTGHASRLNRDGDDIGKHAYGREELVAEMISAYLCPMAGILTTFDNSAAYLGGWIKTIKADPKAIVWAAGRAQKACDLITGYEWKEEEEEEEESHAKAA